MKVKHIFIFIISIYSAICFSQTQQKLLYPQRYGLRLGISLADLGYSLFDKNYFGAEVVADYRVLYRYYATVEYGIKRKHTVEDMFEFTTKGTYIKFGVDYNTYDNWYGMENMIFFGGRGAVSAFSQNVDAYSIANYNNYWNENTEGKSSLILGNHGVQMAGWLELVAGVKVELLHNLYASVDLRLKGILYQSSSVFPNYWIPGFGKVWEGSVIGVGCSYTLTYLIPFIRKSK